MLFGLNYIQTLKTRLSNLIKSIEQLLDFKVLTDVFESKLLILLFKTTNLYEKNAESHYLTLKLISSFKIRKIDY
jgi:hypothetical protein